jgi:hypothetical protein
MSIKATKLNPSQNLDGKHNFQRFVLVEKDGRHFERIILSVPDIKIREQIICFHFLGEHVRMFVKEVVGVRYLSRDNPWDFEVELSTSEKLIIEITSIADQEDLFKKYKYEERLLASTNSKMIKLKELEKLTYNFPDNDIEKLIHLFRREGIKNNDLVSNHHYQQKTIFQSRFDENIEAFDQLLKKAIEKKLAKKHPHKENVTLIIDNRTVTFTLEHILEHLQNMSKYFEQLPFCEIWLYTGYYSDIDGNNAEYSLAPLKISDQKAKIIEESIR